MGVADFSRAYQKSPIILTGGIATNVPGGMLPIISITQAADFNRGVLQGSSDLALNDFLFDFRPLPGGRLVENQVGTYPFANQAVAGNAIIAQPLSISLLMVAPARTPGGFAQKQAVFGALKSALDQHTSQGGTYTVATPAYLYVDLILTSLRDITQDGPGQPQSQWQWDFFKPLLTAEAAQAAQNSLMQKISGGTKVTPGGTGAISYSGQGAALGDPASGQGPPTIPAARPLAGASVGSAFAPPGFPSAR